MLTEQETALKAAEAWCDQWTRSLFDPYRFRRAGLADLILAQRREAVEQAKVGWLGSIHTDRRDTMQHEHANKRLLELENASVVAREFLKTHYSDPIDDPEHDQQPWEPLTLLICRECQQAVEQARLEIEQSAYGRMLDMIRGSLKDYPIMGVDLVIMSTIQEIERQAKVGVLTKLRDLCSDNWVWEGEREEAVAGHIIDTELDDLQKEGT